MEAIGYSKTCALYIREDSILYVSMSYFIAVSDYAESSASVVLERIGRNVEGNGRTQLEISSRNLLAGTEYNHKIQQDK
jgi:hypothetical protein